MMISDVCKLNDLTIIHFDIWICSTYMYSVFNFYNKVVKIQYKAGLKCFPTLQFSIETPHFFTGIKATEYAEMMSESLKQKFYGRENEGGLHPFLHQSQFLISDSWKYETSHSGSGNIIVRVSVWGDSAWVMCKCVVRQ